MYVNETQLTIAPCNMKSKAMILIKILFLMTCIQLTVSLEISPGERVPHAEVLDEILLSHTQNYTDPNSITIFDYLFGHNVTELENLQISEHLDLCVLSPENIKKIVDEAKRKMMATKLYKEVPEGPHRRKNYIYYDRNRPWIIRAFNWMKQAIYGTRRRLEVTRPYRKKFHRDISYNIGILSGILKEMMKKADGVFAAMMKMHLDMFFQWFIFAYQRILAFHVDMSYIVERIFEYQKKWNILIGKTDAGDEGDEEYGGGSGNLTEFTVPEMSINEDIWSQLDNLPDEMKPGFQEGSGLQGPQGPHGPPPGGDPGTRWDQGGPGPHGPPPGGDPGIRWDQGRPGPHGPPPGGDPGTRWDRGGPGPWGGQGPQGGPGLHL